MNDASSAASSRHDERRRVILLIGQSISLGMFVCLLLIASNALFLATFGSSALPYAYLAVAALGAVTFYALASFQRTWSLHRLALLIDTSLVATALAGWLALTAGLAWVSFLLVVAISLSMQAGFVVLGGQVGRLFDVRQIKRLFPRVVFGFATGFMLGGLVSGPLLGILGATQNLLLATTVAGLVMIGFLVATTSSYPVLRSASVQQERRKQARPLSQLLARRYVLLIFGYQMLAALTSQLLDFILLDRSGARFASSEALASFLGTYNTVLNLADMLFLALLAGWLLGRFGLGLGFLANPVSGTVLLFAMVGAGLLAGPASSLFFFLIALSRLLNIVLTDGTMRTSLNAAYQALPMEERTAVQTGVEGIGLPLAVGCAGLLLIVLRALGITNILITTVLTLAFALIWSAGGWLVYRSYAGELLQTLRRRALGQAPLNLDDRSSLDAALSLLDSPQLAQVRLGLDALENAQYSGLNSRVTALLESPDPPILAEALARTERLRIGEARQRVIAIATSSTDSSVRAAAYRAWSALDGATALPSMTQALAGDDLVLRRGILYGLLAYGGEDGWQAASPALVTMMKSPDPDQRAAAAAALAGASPDHAHDPLCTLLLDPAPDVRRAALASAGSHASPEIVERIATALADRHTRSAAMNALVAAGPLTLPLVEAALSDPQQWSNGAADRLVRAAAQIEAAKTTDLLLRHIGHPHPDVRAQVLEALCLQGWKADSERRSLVNQALQAEADHGKELLRLRGTIGGDEAIAPVRRALEDDLAATRHRVFLLLSLLYDRHALQRAEERIVRGQGATRSLAVETLEVTLSGEHRAALMPLLNPAADPPKATTDIAGALHALVETADAIHPAPWARTCALFAAGKLQLAELRGLAESFLDDADPDVRATSQWTLAQLRLPSDRLPDTL